MRRSFAMLLTTALMIAAGCGGKSYETRLERTIEELRYQKRLDDNLMPAPTKGKLEQLLIFVRPPKTLEGPTKEFQLTVLEAGKFDVADSFIEPDKQALHILARVKKPKAAPGKKAATPVPAESTARGPFNADVIALLNGVYNIELDPAKAKEEVKNKRSYRRLTFEANGKDIQLYLYGSKTTPYEVALIFEYPKSESAALVSKIELCLGSFATGERARRAYTGKDTEEESSETTEATSSGGAAF